MESKNTSRRKILRLAALGATGTGASLSMVSQAEAQKRNLKLGEINLLQIVLEHDFPGGGSGIAEGPPNYIINTPRKLGGCFTDYSVDSLSNMDAAIATGRKFLEPAASLFGETQPYIVTKSGYLASPEKLQYLARPYQHPTVSVSAVTQEGAEFSVANVDVEVPRDEQVAIDLDQRSVFTYSNANEKADEVKTEERIVTPRVKARHLRKISMFGSTGRRVIPLNPDDARTRRLLASYRESESSTRIENENGALLVIDKSGNR